MGKLLVWTLWGHPCMWRHIFSILVSQGTMLYLVNGLGWFTLNFHHCFDWKLPAFACSCLKQFGQFLCHVYHTLTWCSPILSSFSLFGSSANKINTKQCCWHSIFLYCKIMQLLQLQSWVDILQITSWFGMRKKLCFTIIVKWISFW